VLCSKPQTGWKNVALLSALHLNSKFLCRKLGVVGDQGSSQEPCGGQSGTGICPSPSCSVFPCQYNSTGTPCSYITRGMNIGPLVVTVQTHSIDMNNVNKVGHTAGEKQETNK
jgi:hypothetical protein